MTFGWDPLVEFRRSCREEYIEIACRLGLDIVRVDGEECAEVVPWLRENLGAELAQKAAVRAEEAGKVLAMPAEHLEFQARKLASRRSSSGFTGAIRNHRSAAERGTP